MVSPDNIDDNLHPYGTWVREAMALPSADGDLKALTGHGELDLPDGCFVRVNLPPHVNTYWLGMPLRMLIADPLSAGGTAASDAVR